MKVYLILLTTMALGFFWLGALVSEQRIHQDILQGRVNFVMLDDMTVLSVKIHQ